MPSDEILAQRFEEKRGHLRAVAYRMLGSVNEADDAVQESWLRLSRADASEIDNLGAWLTTVVARVCLDMLRSRTSRREESLDLQVSEPVATDDASKDPEKEALLADSVGLAYWLCSTGRHRRSAWHSYCMTCSRCRLRRLPGSSADHPTRRDSSPAARAEQCRGQKHRRRRRGCAISTWHY